VRAYYDEHTRPFYLDRWHAEDIHFGCFPPGSDPRDHHAAVKRMTASIVDPAAIGARDRVLDAGCGVGGAALDLARSSGANVLGVTISPVQVAIATARAESAGLALRARFEVADCSSKLPVDDNSMDVVVSIEAACHFEDKTNFLRECRRVLVPGGRVAFSDWMAAGGLDDEQRSAALDPVCASWRLASLAPLDQWRTMFEAQGFEVREAEDYGEDVLPNATILARARLDLMLEAAGGLHDAERARLWQAQYDTLVAAWLARRFTIGRIFAVAL
jgi:cyclopropane fatty-acyl-phospholipid synthase-like methyltransferase